MSDQLSLLEDPGLASEQNQPSRAQSNGTPETPSGVRSGSKPTREECWEDPEKHWRHLTPGWEGTPTWNAVAEAIDEDPDTPVKELYRIAKGVDGRIGKLSLRQFNARVPLQIKRKRNR